MVREEPFGNFLKNSYARMLWGYFVIQRKLLGKQPCIELRCRVFQNVVVVMVLILFFELPLGFFSSWNVYY